MKTETKVRRLLLYPHEVLAALDGRLSQVWRVVNPQPPGGGVSGPLLFNPTVICGGQQGPGKVIFGVYADDDEWSLECPFGKPGGRLWGAETWQTVYCEFEEGMVEGDVPFYRADYEDDPDEVDWKPSSQMPQWVSRFEFDLTGVRVKRVQDINSEHHDEVLRTGYPFGEALRDENPIKAFARHWDSVNKKTGRDWGSNPMAWVADLKHVG